MLFEQEEEQKTYRGRKFVQLLQVVLVIAIGAFIFTSLTKPHSPAPVATTEPPVVQATLAPTLAPIAVPTTVAPADTALTLYARAHAEHERDNWNEAIDLYTQSLELDSTSANTWLSRAVAYAQAGTNETVSQNDFWRYLQLTETERIELKITPNESMELDMTEGRVYALSFEVQAGDVFDISANSSVSGDAGDTDVVDPLVLLFDPKDTLVDASDDRLRLNGSLVSMDSRINDYNATSKGTYTILLSHAGGGSEGKIDITVRIR